MSADTFTRITNNSCGGEQIQMLQLRIGMLKPIGERKLPRGYEFGFAIGAISNLCRVRILGGENS